MKLPILSIANVLCSTSQYIQLLVFALLCIVLAVTYGYKKHTQTNTGQEPTDTDQKQVMVVLVQLGGNPLMVIKILRNYTTGSLAQTKEIIEQQLPATIISQLPAHQARKLQKELEQTGSFVDLVECD